MKIVTQVLTILALVGISQVSLAVEPTVTVSKSEMKMDETKMMEHLKIRQEQILKMHELSTKILAETDPKKKKALEDEQLQLIKTEHMQMMNMHHSKTMNMSH